MTASASGEDERLRRFPMGVRERLPLRGLSSLSPLPVPALKPMFGSELGVATRLDNGGVTVPGEGSW